MTQPVYVGGTVDVGADGIAAQTRRVLERIRVSLEAGGSSLDRALAVTVYLRSASDFREMNDAYREFWPKDAPTRTTVISELAHPAALVQISMVAAAEGAERIPFRPPDWAASPNPYSYAIRSGDTLFLSGLLARNGRDNAAVAGNVATQTRVVMDNAGELLASAGLTHANIVNARVFMPDLSRFQEMNETYRRYFTSVPPPARATVGAGLTASRYSVEMTFIASSATRQVIEDGEPKSPNLSAIIRAGHQVYLSGMLGHSAATTDVASQTKAILARIRRSLAAAGCRSADVVDEIVYLTDVDSQGVADAEHDGFFEGGSPARTTVQSALAVPGGLVEIMMTAVTR